MERPVKGRRRRRQEGFTLIELGVVLAIIAILVAIAVPAYTGMVQRAHDAEAAQAWDMVKSEVWSYYLQHDNTFPTASSGNWPQGIDLPKSTEDYWTYSASTSSDGSSFTFTATEVKGTRTLSWTINKEGTVEGPIAGTTSSS